MSFIFLDIHTLLVLIFPVVIFSYLLLTNSSSIERTLGRVGMDRIYVKGAISKQGKTLLLIVSMLLILLALGRPAMVEPFDDGLVSKRSYAVVVDRSGDSLEMANHLIDSLDGDIALFVLADRLYMLSPPTREHHYLKSMLERVDSFSIGGIKSSFDKSINIDGFDGEVLMVDGVNNRWIGVDKYEGLKYKNIVELQIYPLILATLIIYISIFPPRFSTGSHLFIVLFLLSSVRLDVYGFDFIELDRAKEAYESGEYNKAIDIYISLKGSKYPQLSYNIANCYYRLGRYEEAIVNYVRFEPQDVYEKYVKYFNLGNAYFMIGEYKRALNSYKKAQIAKNTKDIQKNIALTTKAVEESDISVTSKDGGLNNSVDGTERKRKLPVVPFSY